MSVLIKEMDMPNNCENCPFVGYTIDETYCTLTAIAFDMESKCPLVEVSTPHGRLLDEDEILPKRDRKKGIIYCGNLAEITTVIEAED